MNIVIVILIVVAVAVLWFLWVFIGGLIFVRQLTEAKIRLSKEYEVLADGVRTFRQGETPPVPDTPSLEDHKGTQSGCAEMVLLENGELSDKRRVFDDDPGREVNVLPASNNSSSLLFDRNQIFEVVDGRRSQVLGAFSDPEVQSVRHVSAIDDNNLLLIATPKVEDAFHSHAYNVNRRTFEKTQVVENTYFTSARPPAVFKPRGFDGVVAVIYSETYTFAFGGDSSAPQLSTVRLYDSKNPEGKNILRFGFKAGTIVDVRFEDDKLIAVGDPTRPANENKEFLPRIEWVIELAD